MAGSFPFSRKSRGCRAGKPSTVDSTVSLLGDQRQPGEEGRVWLKHPTDADGSDVETLAPILVLPQRSILALARWRPSVRWH